MTTSQDPAHDKDDHAPATLAPPDDFRDDLTEADVEQAAAEVASKIYQVGQKVWVDDPRELYHQQSGWITRINETGLISVAFAPDREIALSAEWAPYAVPFLANHISPAPPPTEPEMLEPIPLPDEWRTRPGKPATPAAPFEAGDIVQVNETEPAHFKRVGIVTKVEFTGELRVKLLDPVELEWFDPENLTLAPGSLYYIPTDIPTTIPPTLQALALQHLTSQVEQLKLITSLRYQIGEHIDSNVETALENGLREMVRSVMKLAAGDPEVSIRV